MTADEVDILVVGGGVVGAGAALDAATRGLSVALVEAKDWASGTSSRSSKLIHGGLRYLEMLDIKLVAEALRERAVLLQRVAPHLVRPVSFLYPLTRRFWERPYAGAGMLLYDTMGMTPALPRGVPAHRHMTKRTALAEAPALKPSALVGAVRYWDAQVDDARFTLSLVRTAASFGALCANQAEVTSYVSEDGRVVGAVVRDRETGRERTVRARAIVNATGVWTDEMQQRAGGRGTLKVRASKGIHLLVPRSRIEMSSGLILRTEKSVLFVIPWGDHWLVGTTDTDWTYGKEHPAVSSADIDYLLEHLNAVLASPLGRDDVLGVYAGLRPLVSGAAEETAKLSREHVVARVQPGLVAIAGGKFTTYRVMAEDAVDAAVRELPHGAPASCTKDVPLIGADGYHGIVNRKGALAERYGLASVRVERLLERYGTLATEVLALVTEDTALGEPLPNAPDYLRAEIVYAATHEGARHLDDVLTRRTHIFMETKDRGLASAEEAARLVAPALGWDEDRIQDETQRYRQRVEAEREAGRQPDDRRADAARMRAPGFGDPLPTRTG
ncbi:glycerol-3-phosphate dehydrogenase [Streptomyces sp. WAC 01420]|uniref:glycerol-3-phosphate dehydrogenase/oxidase n=2 Tax=unclassified Streptomyces TaxID=2593676 RepID=UPI000F71F1F6|nr:MULTISPECIES: glycerol-3-phosphate dehydrogenase/oxidase [unclassified Streptomyces]AZM58489.1 glycerol-3-phosphate dehydrogenase [Streptomyces sp. WAC 01438]RSM88999.1 glycerol-3-phosphate dehydrogenase [Streptomyces sp. WAC 01420]